MPKIYFLAAFFAYCVHASPSPIDSLKGEIMEMNAKIQAIRTDTVHWIVKEYGNVVEPKDTVDGKASAQLGDLANVEVVVEQLHQFVVELSTQKWASPFLAEGGANLVHLKANLLKGAGAQPRATAAAAAANELQILKKNLATKIDRAIRLWHKNGGGKTEKGGQTSTQIVDMKVNIELCKLMEEANLDTTIEYEQLVERCAKFETEAQARRLNTENSWKAFLILSNQNSVKKLVGQIEQFVDGPNDTSMSAKLKETLDKIKAGQMPAKNELKRLSENVFKTLDKNANLDWQNVAVYPTGTVSNWRLAMRSYWALINLLKIAFAHNAKSLPGGAKKQEQRHEEGGSGSGSGGDDKEHRSRFEQWLRDNAQLMKSAVDRLFPRIDDGPQNQQKRRRRRKRGAAGEEEEKEVRCRVDWNAWLQCIGLIVLCIIFILLIILLIMFLITAIFGSDSDSNHRHHHGRDIIIFNNNNNNNRSSSSSYGAGYRSYNRPSMDFWSSCSVVWYDVWN